VMTTDVIIVGAGPTGLMLAAELRLAGVRPLVLERQPCRRDAPKAGGLGGQILDLLRYRGLLERFQAACTPCRCRNRCLSGCSTNVPASSASTSAAGTR
jgi:2-polyprenyl-6-methoxyphenol hydroxylase-like FAD-dependent oxidoreductase